MESSYQQLVDVAFDGDRQLVHSLTSKLLVLLRKAKHGSKVSKNNTSHFLGVSEDKSFSLLTFCGLILNEDEKFEFISEDYLLKVEQFLSNKLSLAEIAYYVDNKIPLFDVQKLDTREFSESISLSEEEASVKPWSRNNNEDINT
jgi:hypothetical protein